MYCNIKTCVSVGGINSAIFSGNTGVRQEDKLSPVLFAIFTNDLEDHMFADQIEGLNIGVLKEDQSVYFCKIFILLYADDTVIMADNADSFQNVGILSITIVQNGN